MLKLLNAAAAAIGWLTVVAALLAAVGIGRFIWGFELGGEPAQEADQQPAALLASAR
ncbi:hypothetical protein [Rubrivivax gelatinosus]|uniref:Uncharacterized protein n=1 Tax=Rubrivivax gelatinosus TaxID=28068 RepID=A0A4R2ME85_RUBGE|nr:hypothetical protein [Rubrivivax gelatinosus]TCP05729.1 hypothetical protein EV684_101603 [Rubrivivax gelatinosus]